MATALASHSDTRQKIIDATIRVAAKNGFDRATTGEISRTAGVSEGIIYHYFKSKQDLYMSMIREKADKYRQALTEELEKVDGCENKLKKLIDFHFVNFTGKNSIFNGVLDRSGDAPVIKEQVAKIAIVPYSKIIAGIIEEGIKSGEFKEINPVIASFNLLGMMQLPALIMHFGQAGFSAEAAVDSIKQVFFGGILK